MCQRDDNKSRMMREHHVRFRERFGVKVPLSTRPTWNCKYHIVFGSKYRRKIIFGELKQNIANILSMLCKRKEVHIIEAKICPDHVHMLVEIPPKMSVRTKAFAFIIFTLFFKN